MDFFIVCRKFFDICIIYSRAQFLYKRVEKIVVGKRARLFDVRYIFAIPPTLYLKTGTITFRKNIDKKKIIFQYKYFLYFILCHSFGTPLRVYTYALAQSTPYI